MVGPTFIEEKLDKMLVEEMIFHMNGSDYQYMGPTADFHTSPTQEGCTVTRGIRTLRIACVARMGRLHVHSTCLAHYTFKARCGNSHPPRI